MQPHLDLLTNGALGFPAIKITRWFSMEGTVASSTQAVPDKAV